MEFKIPPTQRNRIYERDNHKCQICGISNSLTIHHIYGTSQCSVLALDDNNMITLCSNCHKRYHKKFREVTPYTFAKHLLSMKHTIKRVSVEWTDGRQRDIVLYDEPSMKVKGFPNGDINLAIINVLKNEEEISEKKLIEYMCSNYNTNRIEVHKALNSLSKRKIIIREYVVDRTMIKLSEMYLK